MNALKKIAAGFLISIGFFFIALSISEMIDPGVDEDEPSVITGGFAIGIPPTALGGWLLWDSVRQQKQRKLEQIRSIFFRQVEAGDGYVNLLNFVMETNWDTDKARGYLDERAQEFNATFEPDEQGGVLYYFHLLRSDPSNSDLSDASDLPASLFAEDSVPSLETDSSASDPSDSFAALFAEDSMSDLDLDFDLELTDRHQAEQQQDKRGSMSVMLQACPLNQRIAGIKVIRQSTGLSLKEAKDRVDRLPSLIVSGVNSSTADQLKRDLEAIGATVQLHDSEALTPGPGVFESGMSHQDTVAIILEAFPRDRIIDVIKVVREVTGLGLKEAKDLTDHVPSVILAHVDRAVAEQIKPQFDAIEATIRFQAPQSPG